MYNVVLAKRAVKDAALLDGAGLKAKAAFLLRVIRMNPFQNPPPYEKLRGYQETYSRRINIQHRLVYEVRENENVVKVIRMWGHYE